MHNCEGIILSDDVWDRRGEYNILPRNINNYEVWRTTSDVKRVQLEVLETTVERVKCEKPVPEVTAVTHVTEEYDLAQHLISRLEQSGYLKWSEPKLNKITYKPEESKDFSLTLPDDSDDDQVSSLDDDELYTMTPEEDEAIEETVEDKILTDEQSVEDNSPTIEETVEDKILTDEQSVEDNSPTIEETVDDKISTDEQSVEDKISTDEQSVSHDGTVEDEVDDNSGTDEQSVSVDEDVEETVPETIPATIDPDETVAELSDSVPDLVSSSDEEVEFTPTIISRPLFVPPMTPSR